MIIQIILLLSMVLQGNGMPPVWYVYECGDERPLAIVNAPTIHTNFTHIISYLDCFRVVSPDGYSLTFNMSENKYPIIYPVPSQSPLEPLITGLLIGLLGGVILSSSVWLHDKAVILRRGKQSESG